MKPSGAEGRKASFLRQARIRESLGLLENV
jgi:hypothetical protein